MLTRARVASRLTRVLVEPVTSTVRGLTTEVAQGPPRSGSPRTSEVTEVDVGSVEVFWEQARGSLGGSAPAEPPEAWAFGDSAVLADALLSLVLDGTKTATSSALWEYEADDAPLPRAGEWAIILDGSGLPRCVVETTAVEVVPMDEVDADFAAAEGEGDRTLHSWWDGHERYFRRNLPRIGRDFDRAMPLVLERFAVRYP